MWDISSLAFQCDARGVFMWDISSLAFHCDARGFSCGTFHPWHFIVMHGGFHEGHFIPDISL